MAQHDYIIANQSGAAFRADLNNGLAAIVSQNSGPSEPSTTYAYQWWADTTTGLLKLRNAANNAWVTVGTLASANLGLLGSGSTIVAALGNASTPGITFTGDLNTGIYSPGADQVAVATNGSGRLFINSTGQVGIGTSSPNVPLEVVGNIHMSGAADRTIFNRANNALSLGTNNTTRLHITNAGNVGIGTTSPGAPLDIPERLRIRGSTSGYSQIAAPPVAGDETFTLPGTGGTLDRLNRAGNILQVVQTNKTDTFTTTSTSFTDVTGISASITPSLASSKILILLSINADHSSNNYTMFRILRGSTDLLLGNADGSRIQATFAGSHGEGNRPATLAYMLLDAPNATSETTYKIQIRVNTGTGFINRASTDTNSTAYARTASTITLMEVAA